MSNRAEQAGRQAEQAEQAKQTGVSSRTSMAVPVAGCSSVGLAVMMTVMLMTLGTDNGAEACSCIPAHPQQHFCYSDVGE